MTNQAKMWLLKDPWRFEFFQAMRLMMAGAPADSRFHPAIEPLKISVNQSLGFPLSDIASIEDMGPGQKPRMKVNFLGLTGPSGTLPVPYTSLMIERESDRDQAPVDFFDIFNHRLAMLFYYAWERYRIPVQDEPDSEKNYLREMVLDMLGLAAVPLRDQQSFSDDFFVYYAPLLLPQPRSASALRAIVADYFKVDVDVQQFAGAWYPLEGPNVSRLYRGDADSERLGFGVVAGGEYWSQESMVRLRIGPLDLESFERFLPKGTYYRPLREICRFYSRDEFAFQVQLVLKPDQVPEIELREENAGAKLGWTTWLKSKPFTSTCEDVIIPVC